MTVEDTSTSKTHNQSRYGFVRTKTFRLLSMISLTFGYFLVELVVGHITNSVALVADAFHMLSDIISLVIAVVAVRIAKRRSDINTFGWVRAEVVGANINTVFLLALCLTIVFDAIKRFISPEPIHNVSLLLIVGSIGLGINIIGLFLFQGFHGHSHGGGSHEHSGGSHSHDHADEKTKEDIEIDNVDELNMKRNDFERYSFRALQEAITDCAQRTDEQVETVVEIKDHDNDDKKIKPTKQASMNMHGVFLHVLADALGSVVVIVSALLNQFVPHDPENKKHWTVFIDPTLSIIIISIITISAIPLLRETSYILLQTIPRHLEIQEIKSQLLENVPEIDGIHELHVWRLTSEKIIASAHLNRSSLSNYMTVADKVKKFFHSIGIHSVTIQYECDGDEATNNQQAASTVRKRNGINKEKIAGDCLLRCENDECDTQTCCTKSSTQTNILLNNNNNGQVFPVSSPNHNENSLPAQTSTNTPGEARKL